MARVSETVGTPMNFIKFLDYIKPSKKIFSWKIIVDRG
jgi:hypothetical protein